MHEMPARTEVAELGLPRAVKRRQSIHDTD
jgi:hypothetical protein